MTMNREILRFVDTIHRDRQIDKEVIFRGIEMALLSAAQKKFGTEEGIDVTIDRESGDIHAVADEEPLSPEDLGRIAALSGKQVLFQKIREAERDVVYHEYLPKVGQMMSGTVQSKKPGGVMIIALGKAEGFLPRSEQSPIETFNEGDRIKVLLKEVNLQPNRVQLLCSRSDSELVQRLFELEIPEVADYVVEIKAIAREPGYRTKIAVATYDANVDCVGACVGVKGARIRNVVDELFGEKIDIVRWNDSIEILLVEALRPAEIASLELDFDEQAATVFVKSDQQSLAIGRRGQNVRLASKLTGWELTISPVTDEDLDRMRDEGLENLATGLFQDRLQEAKDAEAAEGSTEGSSALDALLVAKAAEKLQEDEAELAVPTHDPLAAALRKRGEAQEPERVSTAIEDAFAAAANAERPTRLEDLPGVDAELIERLRSMGCQGVEDLVAIGEDSLASIEGIGRDLAQQILKAIG